MVGAGSSARTDDPVDPPFYYERKRAERGGAAVGVGVFVFVARSRRWHKAQASYVAGSPAAPPAPPGPTRPAGLGRRDSRGRGDSRYGLRLVTSRGSPYRAS